MPNNDRIEDTEHFLLISISFNVQRQDRLTGIFELLRLFVQVTNLLNGAVAQLLLYDDQDLSNDLDRSVLELALRFIHETGQFD